MPLSALTARLVEQLARGPTSASELTQALRVSQPTVSRAIAFLERAGQVVRMGTTRGARYGLARKVESIGSRWPLYRIDESGRLHEVGPLHALERNHYYAPRGPERLRGLMEGLPYYLQDARPAGFLGRTVPGLFPELELPARVVDWTDAHVLAYLTRRGTDNVGNLLLGEEAADRYMRASSEGGLVEATERATRYPALARAAMAGTPPGSSAQGEHPKFLAEVKGGEQRSHVLVKFSPPRTSLTGQRWADLLVAEHIGHELLSAQGIPACRSSLYTFESRAFLEVQRFDRVGAAGRLGAVSLHAIDVARYGQLDSWAACAQRLLAEKLLPAEHAEHIRLLDVFGALIANTDRHFGNITLFDRYEGAFELAPVYDMLPMLFAPQNEQLVERSYEPAPPTAASLPAWPRARALAEEYWRLLGREPRLSEDFRQICSRCLATLRGMPTRGV